MAQSSRYLFARNETEREWWKAVEGGNIARVRELIGQGININMKDKDGDTALMIAAWYGYLEMCEDLIANKAVVNIKNKNGATSLHCACMKGHVNVVWCLLLHTANVNTQDALGSTPSHEASGHNHKTVLEALSVHGANWDIRNVYGRNVIEEANFMESVSCVSYIESVWEGKQRVQMGLAQQDEQLVQQLLEKMEEKQGQLEEARTQVEEKEWETEQLRQQAARDRQRDEDNLRLTQQLQEKESHIEQLRQQEEENDRQTEQLHRQHEDKNRQIEQLRQQLDEKGGQIEQLRHELERKERDSDTLREQSDDLAAQNQQLIEDKLSLQRQVVGLIAEKEAISTEKEALQQGATILEELLGNAEAANEETRRKLRERQQEPPSPSAIDIQEGNQVLQIPSADIQLTDIKLGSGAFGVVRVGKWRGCKVAIKMLHEVLIREPHQRRLFHQEVSVSWSLHHPNIVPICGVTLEIEERPPKAWISMELMQGSMSDIVVASRKSGAALTLRECTDLSHDCLTALNYLHCLPCPVLHGDIRPTNILVTPVMRAKLGDLGAARYDNASLSVGLVSPQYTAPERLDSRSAGKSKKTDVYSMGVSVCELYSGEPASRDSRQDHILLVQQRDVRFVCMQMVADNSDRRPWAGEALAAIERVGGTEEYKDCPPRRMVRGLQDGVQSISLTDHMW